MTTKHYAIFIIMVMLVIIVCLQCRKEQFSTRREKAQTIYEWFKQNPSPTYTKYKSDFKNSSNVVEYEHVLNALRKSPNFTTETVEKNI